VRGRAKERLSRLSDDSTVCERDGERERFVNCPSENTNTFVQEGDCCCHSNCMLQRMRFVAAPLIIFFAVVFVVGARLLEAFL